MDKYAQIISMPERTTLHIAWPPVPTSGLTKVIVSEDPGLAEDWRCLPVTVIYQNALHRRETCSVSKTLQTASGVKPDTSDALNETRTRDL